MLQSLLNSLQSLSPPDGHILVAGDIWINQSQCQDLEGARPECVRHPSAAGLALGLADAGLTVTLVGFVGDDDLAGAIEKPLHVAGVASDLLHIKHWQTFTDRALDSLANTKGALDAQGRRRRRHRDERALPIDGMSEYEAHLQNRAERYMHNASAVVLVDYDLGSIAEPRALIFVANQLGIPCIAALGSQRRADQYTEADRLLQVSDCSLTRSVDKIASSLPPMREGSS